MTDSRNGQIIIFSETGKIWRILGETGTGEGEMNRPSALAIHQNGTIIVVDGGNNRLQIWG